MVAADRGQIQREETLQDRAALRSTIDKVTGYNGPIRPYTLYIGQHGFQRG
jgi:hypothetical protein